MRPFNTLRAAAIGLLALGTPALAFGQMSAQETRRPYRGLFGGSRTDGTGVNLNVQVFGAYDDNVLARGQTAVDPRLQKSGYFGGATASVTFQQTGEHASFSLSGMTGLRYYPDMSEVTAVSHGVTGGMTLTGAKTTLQTRGGFLWAPLYGVWLAPLGSLGDDSLAPPGDLPTSADYAVSRRGAAVTHASVDVGRSLTRRMSLNAGYQFQFVDFQDEPLSQRHDVVRVGLGYRVTRYSTFRVGYARREYRLTSVEGRRGLSDITAGFDYARPWSLSGRRTTLTVRPGYQIAERQGDLRLHLTGSVLLLHELGRTWTAQASYQRGMRFLQGVGQEMLTDSLQLGVGGFFNRRVQGGLAASYSAGERGFDNLDRQYKAGAVSARIAYAVNRNLSLFTQYIYFNYSFDNLVVLPVGTPRNLDRQGIRVGLSLWTPLLR